MGEELEEREIGPIFRDIRRYYCEFCSICRSKKSLINSHILSHHQEELEKKREVEGEDKNEGQNCNNTCEECGASFKKPAHLKQHMLSHSLERSFVCPINDCNASYRRKDHLNRHILQHQGKLFKCPIENCCKEFSVQGNVSRHLKEFHEDKPEPDTGKGEFKHVCEENGCGKEFKYASQLRKHAETHVLESSETFCADPSCMKPFANVDCLKAHIRSCHQYVNCEVCGSKHLRKNYKRHLSTHGEHLPTILKCTFEGCDHSFTTKSNMQQHVKAVHLKLRPFICSFTGCGMRFAFKHVRDNHEKSTRHVYVHGDLEEFDEQFRSRPRGGRKRKLPNIEMLMRKRISAPNQCDGVLDDSSEFLSWLLSDDDNSES
ncbi:transcription factor IIIA-like [Chenopodium quinoa]|uniref:transcription factor IIIA-like n=1 Tax=Chenopodium quinoa TaxID=63459 RepID=UPI000B7762CA|nr:transcription factor IIIA-like [Chenopodium quinoa]